MQIAEQLISDAGKVFCVYPPTSLMASVKLLCIFINSQNMLFISPPQQLPHGAVCESEWNGLMEFRSPGFCLHHHCHATVPVAMLAG